MNRFRTRLWIPDQCEYNTETDLVDKLVIKGHFMYPGDPYYFEYLEELILNYYGYIRKDYIKIYNASLQACTELKDSEEKLIHEGDFLQNPQGKICYLVTYLKYTFYGLPINYETDKRGYATNIPTPIRAEEFPKLKIVGNIHQNSDNFHFNK